MAPAVARFDPQELVMRLAARFGVELLIEKDLPKEARFVAREPRMGGVDQPVLIRAADIPHPNGFCLKLTSGWRSIEATFLPDTYAGNLIRSMGNASAIARGELAQLAETFSAIGNRLSLKINDVPIREWSTLPSAPWHRFELTAVRLTDAAETGADRLTKEAEEVATACLALVLSQLPLEEGGGAVPLFERGLPEGAKSRVEVNRYERSPVNRAACIALFGARCDVCRLSFSERYGELGEGYIEVHHRIPVAKMGAGYIVNPSTDLVPLCSNCHSMVHRHDPPLETNELRKKLIP